MLLLRFCSWLHLLVEFGCLAHIGLTFILKLHSVMACAFVVLHQRLVIKKDFATRLASTLLDMSLFRCMCFKFINRFELLPTDHACFALTFFGLSFGLLLFCHVLWPVTSLELMLYKFLFSHKVRFTNQILFRLFGLVITVINMASFELVIT